MNGSNFKFGKIMEVQLHGLEWGEVGRPHRHEECPPQRVCWCSFCRWKLSYVFNSHPAHDHMYPGKGFRAINMKNLLCSSDFISFSLCLFLFKSVNKFFLRTTWSHHLNKQPHRWPGKRTSVCIMFPAKIAAWALVWTHSIWTHSLILCSELTWSLCRRLLSDLGMRGYVS